MALYSIFKTVSLFLSLIETCVFVYVLLTWVAPRSGLCYWLAKFIYPFCAPFQSLSNAIRRRWGGMLDFTCLFTLIGLSIAERVLWEIYYILLRLF